MSSSTAICGGLSGVVTAGGYSKQGMPKASNGGSGSPALVPVVGLVNRGLDSHMQTMRLQINTTRKGNVAQQMKQNRRQTLKVAAAGKALSVNEDSFDEEVLKSTIPVLVEYWATWCGPCRLMGMVMDWAAQEYEGRMKCVKIETDPNEGLKAKYKVYGLPTIMLFVNGEEVPGSRKEGAMNKEKLAIFLQQVLPTLASTN
ncbi:hypothetical protein R1flu_006693 [Riccia fluitans]|uniref:Thioredoxin domain-containing protein n=1 Tax=Riccia fluitans TaxID=41844 RepID=A0ABD1YZF7_9MARC